jgi:hypothetical protein
MDNNFQISLKTLWLFVNGLLLAVGGASLFLGAEEIMLACWMPLILLSFPCNILAGKIFFASGVLFSEPGSVILMFLAFIGMGYVQWFILVPKLLKYISGKFARHDRDINVKMSPTQVTAPSAENLIANEWRPDIYDEQERTPVERVLSDTR